MKAFYGKQELKDKYVKQLEAHYKADEIIKGKYWENGKGCAIGCLLHSNQHKLVEELFDFPRVIARLADSIFEGLSNNEAKEFFINWFKAIKVNSDLSLVFPKFMYWLLIDPKHGIIQYADKRHIQIIQNIANLFKRKIDGELVSSQEFAAAAAAAYAAAAAAYAAAAAAAYAADAAAAAAAYAAAAAAYAATDAAYAAADAADAAAADAAYAAYAAAAADAADDAAKLKARTYQATKFIELIKAA